MLASNRATNLLLVVILAVGIGIVAMLASNARGGPLDPPGPPASTLRNIIFQPASCAGFPIVISAPGSYQLGSDLHGCPAKDGIQIATSNVTLDLAGHNVDGGGTASGSLIGIKNTGANGQPSISNGHVQQWGGSGIDLTGASVAQVDRVVAAYNGGAGIVIDSASTITNSTASANTYSGIDAVGTSDRISACQTDSNIGNGILLEGDGSLVEDCEVNGNLNGIFGVNIERVVRNHVHNNSSYGVRLSSSATIDGNSIQWNGADGVACTNNCSVTHNTVSNNSRGIYVNGGVGVVDDNHVFGNGSGGIAVVTVSLGFPNVLLRNVSTGNVGYNYSIGGNNDAGPFSSAGAATSPSTNYNQ